MATKRRDFVLELAIAAERIRGLEATVALLQEALLAAASAPVNVNTDSTSPGGPGFSLLAQRALANTDPEPEAKPAESTTDGKPKVTWFKTDGTGHLSPTTAPTPEAA